MGSGNSKAFPRNTSSPKRPHVGVVHDGESSGAVTVLRVFISSTFVDMHGERDALISRVFPELNQRCRSRKIRLVPVDLRWGVSEEETATIQSLCLGEIDRCRTGRHNLPWFISLRGNRYGWVQEAYETGLLPEANYQWLEELRAESRQLSITQLEVLHAVLSHPRTHVQVPHAFAYFRDNTFMDDVPPADRWMFDFDYKHPEEPCREDSTLQYTTTPLATQYLQDLVDVNRALQRSKLCRSSSYSCSFLRAETTGELPSGKRFGCGWVGELDGFIQQVTDDLWLAICAEFPEVDVTAQESALALEEACHLGMSRRFAAACVDWAHVCTTLTDRVLHPVHGPLHVVVGPGGGGKTTALCDVAQKLEDQGTVVVRHLCGSTPRSLAEAALLTR